jgi:hypothetical protein
VLAPLATRFLYSNSAETEQAGNAEVNYVTALSAELNKSDLANVALTSGSGGHGPHQVGVPIPDNGHIPSALLRLDQKPDQNPLPLSDHH